MQSNRKIWNQVSEIRFNDRPYKEQWRYMGHSGFFYESNKEHLGVVEPM